jgi:hypothetical protein
MTSTKLVLAAGGALSAHTWHDQGGNAIADRANFIHASLVAVLMAGNPFHKNQQEYVGQENEYIPALHLPVTGFPIFVTP